MGINLEAQFSLSNIQEEDLDNPLSCKAMDRAIDRTAKTSFEGLVAQCEATGNEWCAFIHRSGPSATDISVTDPFTSNMPNDINFDPEIDRLGIDRESLLGLVHCHPNDGNLDQLGDRRGMVAISSWLRQSGVEGAENYREYVVAESSEDPGRIEVIEMREERNAHCNNSE
ncbi:MAG: hypothetical protein V2I43_21500 [Parvularcula sp.]|jgi:hypothetical protein|nr:hypothetical protein [Parvularcula sp.]